MMPPRGDPRGSWDGSLYQGVYRRFGSPYHCLLSHCLSGCLAIRFLSGGRLDDRNYAFPAFFGQFRQIDLPSDPSPGSHRINYSNIGSRRSASPSRSSPLAASWRGNGRPQARSRAELYPLSRVVMEGRGWSTAYVSPRHHRDLLAGPQRRSVRRSREP